MELIINYEWTKVLTIFLYSRKRLWPSQHRTQQKIIVLTRTHKTQMHINKMYFYMQYSIYCSSCDFPLQNHCQSQGRFGE
jgi:hypothetical protein